MSHQEIIQRLRVARSDLRQIQNQLEYIRIIKIINGLTDNEALLSLREEQRSIR
jgi:hypothetical protein